MDRYERRLATKNRLGPGETAPRASIRAKGRYALRELEAKEVSTRAIRGNTEEG